MGTCRGAWSLSEEEEPSEEAETLSVGSSQACQGLKERVLASTGLGQLGAPVSRTSWEASRLEHGSE